jgi:drug/metabolite transporter (DMT)-like permease
MAPADSHENSMRGIFWMLATMFCFITLDAIMKSLLEHYSLVQVTWGRFFFGTAFAALMCGRDILSLIKSHAPEKQLLRSILLMSTTGVFNAGIRSTPLATGTTMMFLSPILVTLLSIPLLGEKVGIRRWVGIVMGFAGAVIVAQPWKSGLAGIGVGILFLLVAALLNANYQIVTRMVRNDDPLTSLLFTATAGAVVTTCLVPWFWTWPTSAHWVMFLGSGPAGAPGPFFPPLNLRLAPASVVAPFSYSSLIWATLFGFTIWGDWPDFWTWVGAAIIIGSGLYIFQRERRLNAVAIET